jgi:hypothetical protein
MDGPYDPTTINHMPDPSLNPFVWTDAVALPDAVSRQPFTSKLALDLKGGTHVALFGPRGTGKTSFLLELEGELAKEQSEDAPPWSMIRIDLRAAISIPAFIGAVSTALKQHPERQLRRRAASAFRNVEKELGVNLGVVKAGVKSGARESLNEEMILQAQLAALPKLSERLVIAFDEFQRLASCPGEPLSQIRTALMGPANAGHVSLVLTGSLREKLRLMLKTDTEPIWDQTLERELPELDAAAFIDYLQLRFEASGKPIADEAVEHLADLGGHHPKRTQQIAFQTWDSADANASIDRDMVDAAYEDLVRSEDKVGNVVDQLMSGDEAQVNEAKTLYLLGGGGNTGSRQTAQRYGMNDEGAVSRALERLKARGIVSDSGATGKRWRVVDPLLAEWLRRNDPLSPSASTGLS